MANQLLTLSRLAAALVAIAAAAHADDAYKVITAVEYSHPQGVSLHLDAHIPPGTGPFPAVVLVHGGGWTAGDRTAAFVRPLFGVLDQTGFAWFTIDYRLAPAHSYPEAVDDVEAAVRYVKQHAKEYHVDSERIALMGESAGGHLVNLVGARNNAGVAAVVCFYGPIDMVLWSERLKGKPLSTDLKAFFGIDSLDQAGIEKIRQTSPRIYLNPKTPPFLIIHGTKDEAVDFGQAQLAVELLNKNGTPCELITVQDGVHGVINWEKEQRFQAYQQPLIAWLHRTLAK